MIITNLQLIYDRLHYNGSSSYKGIESIKAIRYLTDQLKFRHDVLVFKKLINQIDTDNKYLPTGFIEKFCISYLAKIILDHYSLNIAEAYIISHVTFEKPVIRTTVFHKLCSSGVLSPTVIDGVLIQDIEAIAEIAMNSLIKNEFIKVTEHKYVIPGKKPIIIDEHIM